MKDIRLLAGYPFDDSLMDLLNDVAASIPNMEDDALDDLKVLKALFAFNEETKCRNFIKNDVTLVLDAFNEPRKRSNLASLRRAAKRILQELEDFLSNSYLSRIKSNLKDLSGVNNSSGKNEIIGVLMRNLEEMNNIPKDLQNALDKLISDYGYVDMDILGNYSFRTKTITIYFKNIFKHHNYNYKAAVATTLAHEIFHAYHFHLLKLRHLPRYVAVISTKKRDYEILKESLASYFEHHFANKHGAYDIATQIENEWHRYHPYVYPYSGARWIIDKLHFTNVVSASTLKFDLAFDMLKNPYYPD